ncbi:hypothetical protein LZ32DRAFT_263716 [Colletotrichum eremochloae]|nr:hypothetical protein LZ32DRAFT_263716 [Colletotrichum eremochloae]
MGPAGQNCCCSSEVEYGRMRPATAAATRRGALCAAGADALDHAGRPGLGSPSVQCKFVRLRSLRRRRPAVGPISYANELYLIWPIRGLPARRCRCGKGVQDAPYLFLGSHAARSKSSLDQGPRDGIIHVNDQKRKREQQMHDCNRTLVAVPWRAAACCSTA